MHARYWVCLLITVRNKVIQIHGQGKALTETGLHHTTSKNPAPRRSKLANIKVSLQRTELLHHRLRINRSEKYKNSFPVPPYEKTATKNKGQDPNDQFRISQRMAKTGRVQEMIERESQEGGVVLKLEASPALARRDFQRRIINCLPSNIPKSGIVT
jgi:hypothetical protein